MNFISDKMETVTMMIDRNLAEEMLAKNIENNRKLKQKWVNALADSMRRGAFTLSPQGIAFDKAGYLIDGQHRLTAVIKSGCTVPMRVTFGCDNKAIGVLDAGAIRKAQDVAKMYSHDSHISRSNVIAAFSALLRHRNSSVAYSLSPGEMCDVLLANDNAARLIYAITVSKRMSHIDGTVRGALLEAMLVTGDVQAVYDFRNAWELGEINTDRDYCNQIVFSFKQRLVNNKIKHIRMTPANLYNLTQNCFYQFLNAKSRTVIKGTSEDRYICNVQDLLEGNYDSRFDGLEVTPHGIVYKPKEGKIWET